MEHINISYILITLLICLFFSIIVIIIYKNIQNEKTYQRTKEKIEEKAIFSKYKSNAIDKKSLEKIPTELFLNKAVGYILEDEKYFEFKCIATIVDGLLGLIILLNHKGEIISININYENVKQDTDKNYINYYKTEYIGFDVFSNKVVTKKTETFIAYINQETLNKILDKSKLKIIEINNADMLKIS